MGGRYIASLRICPTGKYKLLTQLTAVYASGMSLTEDLDVSWFKDAVPGSYQSSQAVYKRRGSRLAQRRLVMESVWRLFFTRGVCLIALFGAPSVHSACQQTEYVTRVGDCCRYPNPGQFVLQNCTKNEGIRTKNCTICPNLRIVANCTHFSDTQCEPIFTTPATPPSTSLYFTLMVSPVVIGVIFSTALIYWLCIQSNSRRSPWIPYLPHCLSTYLRYHKADKNSEVQV